jgi:hypothetical protein
MKNKGASLAQMEEVARQAIRAAMLREGLSAPPTIKSRLIFGNGMDEEMGHFNLYLPGATPQEGIELISATVHRLTGHIKVTITDQGRKLLQTG